MEDILKTSMGIASSIKYKVQIESGEIVAMSYYELGIYLIQNSSNIERVHIILKTEVE